MFEIRIALSGEKDIVRRMEALEERTNDLTPAWPAVDAVFSMIVAQQFHTEGAHGGAEWAPLHSTTQRQRLRDGYGAAHPILRRTFDLYRSLTTLNADSISVHHERYYARGTGVEYFWYHQAPGARWSQHGRGLPRRAMIQFTADDKNELVRPIRIHLRGGDPTRTARQDDRLRSTFAQGTS